VTSPGWSHLLRIKYQWRPRPQIWIRSASDVMELRPALAAVSGNTATSLDGTPSISPVKRAIAAAAALVSSHPLTPEAQPVEAKVSGRWPRRGVQVGNHRLQADPAMAQSQLTRSVGGISSPKGPWRLSSSSALRGGLTNARLTTLPLPSVQWFPRRPYRRSVGAGCQLLRTTIRDAASMFAGSRTASIKCAPAC